MSMKIVLNISFMSDSDKSSILKSVTKVIGITSLSFDDEKRTLTVEGNLDAVEVVKRLRKGKWKVDIVTVGPAKEEKEEEKKEEKKEEEKKVECPPPYFYGPPISGGNNRVVLVYDEPPNLCAIL